ncbi:CDP-alcohol phosphatidyltransferase family protein [Thiocystis violacea]|uniref:CDP-alcohol phosphatidyltransferase family protein n=1 Tax=Thiocystis violacea TaxID=13725 RepID=UPI001908E113|nr:CDP-alcohol phosphatidyltransferase family protein [Thiocystis violacea]MBK1723144.1 hypothetical protein [Thiocystis violacea]
MPPSDERRFHCLADARARLARSALVNAVMGLLLLTLLAHLLAGWMGLGGWAALKSAAVYAVVLGWLSRQLPGHLPHPRLFPANQVTLLRLGLTALLAGWIGEPLDLDSWRPALVAALILVLDGLDGWLARRGGWASAFGARFDMETDALLVLVLAALIFSQDKAGHWILLIGLARYLFLASARIWPWLNRPLPPSRRRQTFCVLIVLTLLLTLTPPIQPPASMGLAALGLVFVGYSFAVDLWWLWRQGPERAQPRRRSPKPAPIRGDQASDGTQA